MVRRTSLTARLVAGYAIASALVLLGMAILCALAVKNHFEELDQETLRDKLLLVKGIVSRAHTTEDLRQRLDESLRYHEGLQVRVIDETGQPVYSSGELWNVGDWESRASEENGTMTLKMSSDHVYRMVQSPNAVGASPSAPFRIWVATDTQQHIRFLRFMRETLWIYLAVAVPLSAIIGWWIARAGLRPLRDMRARAQVITAERLQARMPVESAPVELADLAQSLNDMLDRLQRDFERLGDFASNLAHELRTPIGNLLTQTQVALAQGRDARFYRDVLASNAEEIQRLGRTVSDMLFLARADHGLLALGNMAVNLADEVQALASFYEAIAQEKEIDLQVSGSAQVRGDGPLLRRAVSNLLSNALRHTPRHGQVRVHLEDAGSKIRLSVENTGADIAAEDLPRVFERFFRGANATSSGEGAGLGLSITHAITQAHGGRTWVRSAGGRTEFGLELPAAPAAALQSPAVDSQSGDRA